MQDKLFELLVSLIGNTKNWNLKILNFKYFVLFFLLISILMTYISIIYGIKDNNIVNHIWIASFYIFAFLGFLYLISISANVVEEKEELISNINELRNKIYENFKDSFQVEKYMWIYKDRWNLIYFKVNEVEYSIWYFLNDNKELDSLWIYSSNEDIVKSFWEKIEDSDYDYKIKFLKEDRLKLNLVPKDSKELHKKWVNEIIKLINEYIKVLKIK